jgi:uncharacterized Zn finger protein
MIGMSPSREKNPKKLPAASSTQKIEPLCNDCGEAFSDFLQQMEEHNAKVVVCPKCGKVHDYTPTKAGKTPARKH